MNFDLVRLQLAFIFKDVAAAVSFTLDLRIIVISLAFLFLVDGEFDIYLEVFGLFPVTDEHVIDVFDLETEAFVQGLLNYVGGTLQNVNLVILAYVASCFFAGVWRILRVYFNRFNGLLIFRDFSFIFSHQIPYGL